MLLSCGSESNLDSLYCVMAPSRNEKALALFFSRFLAGRLTFKSKSALLSFSMIEVRWLEGSCYERPIMTVLQLSLFSKWMPWGKSFDISMAWLCTPIVRFGAKSPSSWLSGRVNAPYSVYCGSAEVCVPPRFWFKRLDCYSDLF